MYEYKKIRLVLDKKIFKPINKFLNRNLKEYFQKDRSNYLSL